MQLGIALNSIELARARYRAALALPAGCFFFIMQAIDLAWVSMRRRKAYRHIRTRLASASVKHADLLARLAYDPVTGLFRNRKGRVVGMVDNGGYLSLAVKGALYKAHRLAWFYVHGVWPDQIHHKDKDKLNNRLDNLCSLTASEHARLHGKEGRNYGRAD